MPVAMRACSGAVSLTSEETERSRDGRRCDDQHRRCRYQPHARMLDGTVTDREQSGKVPELDPIVDGAATQTSSGRQRGPTSPLTAPGVA